MKGAIVHPADVDDFEPVTEKDTPEFLIMIRGEMVHSRPVLAGGISVWSGQNNPPSRVQNPINLFHHLGPTLQIDVFDNLEQEGHVKGLPDFLEGRVVMRIGWVDIQALVSNVRMESFQPLPQFAIEGADVENRLAVLDMS